MPKEKTLRSIIKNIPCGVTEYPLGKLPDEVVNQVVEKIQEVRIKELPDTVEYNKNDNDYRRGFARGYSSGLSEATRIIMENKCIIH